MTETQAPQKHLCPKCRTAELFQPSPRASRLLRCPSCRGHWLPSDEARLEAVYDLMESDDTIRPGLATDGKTGLCPDGHGILIRAKVDLDEPFFLERCPECAGIWFDKGEWNKLARGHLLTNLGDLWNPARRWRVQQERTEVAYEEKMKFELGDETYAHILQLAALLADRTEQQKLAALAFLRDKLGA